MRRLAVVAYPTLSDDDRRWIEGIRGRYDPLASRIAAHFTLVFPTQVLEAPFTARVRNALESAEAIPVALRHAAAFPNAIGGGYYVFLLAEQGHRELLTVHEKLYEGVLAAHRRPDIPFVPHVTVGAHPQLGECERLAGQLNEECRIVRGRINSVDIIEVGESMMRTIVEIPLGFGGHQPPNPSSLIDPTRPIC